MSRRLVVVDTNVVVAGLLTSDREAPTAMILDAMLDGRLRFVLSVELLAEYREVLLRPGIVSRHGLDPEEIDEILVALASRGVVRDPAEPPPETRPVPRGDAHLARLLATVPAARIVTGDLALARALGGRALSPRDLVEALLS